MYETWVASFQFYISLFETGLKSILRITNTDADSGNTGDRILIVLMDGENQQLKVHYELRDATVQYTYPNQTSANTWYNLTVRQDFDRGEFLFRIFINGEMVHENPIRIHNPTYTNVSVYAGDMFYTPSVLGWIDELNITTGESYL